MSIDAVVKNVIRNKDGSGKLELIPRNDNPVGQSALYFDKSPSDILNLSRHEIWGGSSIIMYKEVCIAKRIGYTKIQFIISDFKGIL